MKNFLELLDTNLTLEVIVDQHCYSADLHEPLTFDADHLVFVDGIEILPRYRYLAENGVLTIAEPFYCWYHRVSRQGWLLIPQYIE